MSDTVVLCGRCGQPIGSSIGGEYPCACCSTPTLHDPPSTVEARAERIAARLERADAPQGVIVLLKVRAEKEIEAAVAEEREACAQVAAEICGFADITLGEEIAAAIRARAESPSQS